MQMLTLLLFQRLNLQPEKFNEGKVINVTKKSGCGKKDEDSPEKKLHIKGSSVDRQFTIMKVQWINV